MYARAWTTWTDGEGGEGTPRVEGKEALDFETVFLGGHSDGEGKTEELEWGKK